MKIIVVRHGQTNYNVVGLHNADPTIDVFLTEVGINEAKQLAEQFKDEPFDAIFVSELPRTRQTAEYINQFHDLPIIVDKRLNDINSGCDGQKAAEFRAERDASLDSFTYHREGFESSEDVYNRTADFLRDIKKKDYKNVLVVTSKHNFRHFRNIIDHLDPRISLSQPVPSATTLIREI